MLGKGCLAGCRDRKAQVTSLHFNLLVHYKEFLYPLICTDFRMDHGHMDHAGMDMGHGPMCNMNVRRFPKIFSFISC